MTRYKGRPSAKSIERDYPHIIEMLVPPETGLGNRLNEMHDWHTARGIRSRHGVSRREIGTDYVHREWIHWCFADPQTADDFARTFGGVRRG